MSRSKIDAFFKRTICGLLVISLFLTARDPSPQDKTFFFAPATQLSYPVKDFFGEGCSLYLLRAPDVFATGKPYTFDLINKVLTLNLNLLSASERKAIEEILVQEVKEEQLLIDLVDSSRTLGELLGRFSLEQHFANGKKRPAHFDFLVEKTGYLRRSLIRGALSIKQMLLFSQNQEHALAFLTELTSQGLSQGDRGIPSWDLLLMILELHPDLVNRVYVDLDQTLFRPKGFLATELWYQHWKKRKLKDKEVKALKYQFEEKFLKVGFIEDVEPELIERIQRLRKKGVEFCGLTSRSISRKKRTEETLSLLGLSDLPVEYKGKSCNKGPFLLKTIEKEKSATSQTLRYVFLDDHIVGSFHNTEQRNLGPSLVDKYELYPIGYYPPQKKYDFKTFHKKALEHLKKGEKELALRFLIESLHLTDPEVIEQIDAVQASQDALLVYYRDVESLIPEFQGLSDFNELKELFIARAGKKETPIATPKIGFVGLKDILKNSAPIRLGGGSKGEVYRYQAQSQKEEIEVALKYAKANPHARNKNFFTNLFYPITREKKLNYLVQIYEIGEIAPEAMELSIGLKPGERKPGKILPYEVQELIQGKEAKAFLEETGVKKLVAGVQILEQIVWGLLEFMELGLAGHGDLKFDNCMVHRSEDGKIQVKLIDLGAAGKMFFPMYKEEMGTLAGVSEFFKKLPTTFSELVALKEVDTSPLVENIFTTFSQPLSFHPTVAAAIQKRKGVFSKAELFEEPPSGETPFIWDYYCRNIERKLTAEEQERMKTGFQGIRNADVMAYTLRRGIFYMANDILKMANQAPFLSGKTEFNLKGQAELTRTFFAYATLVSQALLAIEPFDSISREKGREKLKTLFADWKAFLLPQEARQAQEFELAI